MSRISIRLGTVRSNAATAAVKSTAMGDAYPNLDQPAKAAERHDQELEVCPSAHDEALTFWLLGRETPTLKHNLQPVAASLRAAGFAWQLLQVAAQQRIEDPPFPVAVVLDDA